MAPVSHSDCEVFIRDRRRRNGFGQDGFHLLRGDTHLTLEFVAEFLCDLIRREEESRQRHDLVERTGNVVELVLEAHVRLVCGDVVRRTDFTRSTRWISSHAERSNITVGVFLEQTNPSTPRSIIG